MALSGVDVLVVLSYLGAIVGMSWAFARRTRRALAGAFLVSRGLALGVVLYASALVVAETLGWPVDAALLLVGAFAAAYTGLGGVVAGIWGRLVQLAPP